MQAEIVDSAHSSGPIVFIIRHGEKPPKAKKGDKDPIGLSDNGKSRADQLPGVFEKPGFNLGLIIAQQAEADGERSRPWLTVKPLVESLGKKVEVINTIDRDDAKGVVAAVKAFEGPGNVLICWEHHALTDIVKAFGVPHHPKKDIEYPDDRYEDPVRSSLQIIAVLTMSETQIRRYLDTTPAVRQD